MDFMLDMPNWSELHLTPQALQQYGLPDIAYPIRTQSLQQAMANQSNLPLAELLFGLQERCRDGDADWQKLELVIDHLARQVAPDDGRETVTAAGDNWWIEIGPVDLNAKLVTIQRGDFLIAAISRRDDGRLRVSVYRPLDAKSAEYITGLGLLPDPQHGVCMRENNWEYALDSSAGNGNFYAAERGEAYLSYWEKGLGISWDGTELPEWRAQIGLSPRAPDLVAAELGVHYTLSGDAEDVESEAPTEVADDSLRATFPTWQGKRQQRRTAQGRFLGCLLGGAVGDALGAPVEFLKRSEILRRFGPTGITSYAPAYGTVGAITDDTQMTLFTAEGLIRAWVRSCFKGITTYPGVTAHAYLRWLQTQGEKPVCDLDFGSDEKGWLFQQSQLHHRRAPGNTCLSALKAMKSLGDPARNDSKGCGGIMRVAPVGLFAWRVGQQDAPQETFRLGAELAALTHGHPTGSLTGGVLAVLIQGLTDGATLLDVLNTAKSILRAEANHEETLCSLEKAEELARTKILPREAIEQLGQGWIAEEALAISVYCALVAKSFQHGILIAVNHDGDSDSTGAIAGNLLGAMYGVKSIPNEWLAPLELRDVITEVAEDLYQFKDWEIGEYSTNHDLNQQIWRKYPGF